MIKINTDKTNWNLEILFKGDDDSSIGLDKNVVKEKTDDFIKKWKKRNDYLKDPEILKAALDDYNELIGKYGFGGRAWYYFYLRTLQDQNDPKLKAKFNKIDEFGKRILNDINFFRLRIAKIKEKEQKKFLDYRFLNEYRHWLERAFLQGKYLLSDEEERILILKSGSSYEKWISMVSGFLSKEEIEVLDSSGKKVKKNFSEIMSLMNEQNKEIRDYAAKIFNDILEKYVELAESEINAILADKKVDDDLRKMSRADLARHLNDDIESEVVDSMIFAVSNRFNIAERYYSLKAKLFGVNKLKYHERNIPYGKIDKIYSYEESVDLVFKVLKNLDIEFADIFRNFVEEGRIDVYPKKGKRDGACCIYDLITSPVYLLLNCSNKISDVLTLAHEVGHGINYELIKKKQNAINFNAPLSTAEVASTFMEDFVLQEIEKEADNELKLSLMMAKLNDDVSTIFRQVACYRFEKELHEKFRKEGYLSKEGIGKIFRKNMASYMGEFVEQSPESERWWVYWSHIRYFFYVYSYASGLLISKSLQSAVKKDMKFVEKVKELLSAGSSMSPKEIFLKLGINIKDKEFWDKGLSEIEDLLNETEKLAIKLRKI